MVFWIKNFFRFQSNKAGKKFVDKITSLIDAWSFDSPSKNIAIKSVMLLPNLLLQKFSPKPSRDINKDKIERRLKL